MGILDEAIWVFEAEPFVLELKLGILDEAFDVVFDDVLAKVVEEVFTFEDVFVEDLELVVVEVLLVAQEADRQSQTL